MGWLSDLGHSIDDSIHSVGSAVDNFARGDFSDAGDFAGQSISDYSPALGDWVGDVGDWTGDNLQFEGWALEDQFNRLKNNPVKWLTTQDPGTTALSNKVFGKNNKSMHTMFGAPSQDAFQRAENDGIDTSNARGMHSLASTIASMYGGQGLAGAYGGGAMGAAGAGATLGAGNAIDNGSSIAKGAFSGGLGAGLANGINFGDIAGIDDAYTQRLVNGGVGGGIRAGVSGQNVLGGVAMGAGGRYLGDMYNGMNVESNFPQGGQSYAPYNPQNDWMGQATNQSIPSMGNGGMPMTSAAGSMPDWLGTTSTIQQPVRPQQSMIQQLQQSPWFQGIKGLIGGANPQAGNALNALSGGQQGGSTFDTIGRTLGSLYTQNRARKDANEQMRRMDASRGAYRQDMENRLSRRDAASGRRSQYGARDVELMARLAELDSRNAPQLNNLYKQRRMANMGSLNDIFSGVRRLGGPGQIYNDVSSWFE